MFINGIITRRLVTSNPTKKGRTYPYTSLLSVHQNHIEVGIQLKSLQFFQLAISSTPCPACLLSGYIYFISHHNPNLPPSHLQVYSIIFFNPPNPQTYVGM